MNISALFALATPQSGKGPSEVPTGFEALLANLQGTDATSPCENLLLSTNEASSSTEATLPFRSGASALEELFSCFLDAEDPSPPPGVVPNLAALIGAPPGIVQNQLRGEEFTTQEPNAQSNPTDLPATQIHVFGTSVSPVANPQVNEFLNQEATMEPTEVAFRQLLALPDLGVKMVRVDLGTEQSPSTLALMASPIVPAQAESYPQVQEPTSSSVEPPDSSGLSAVVQSVPEVALLGPPEIGKASVRETPDLDGSHVDDRPTLMPVLAADQSTSTSPDDGGSRSGAQADGTSESLPRAVPAPAADPDATPNLLSKNLIVPHLKDGLEVGDRQTAEALGSVIKEAGFLDDPQPESGRDESLTVGASNQVVPRTLNDSRETVVKANETKPVAEDRRRTAAFQHLADRIEMASILRPRDAMTIRLDPFDMGEIKLVLNHSEGKMDAQVYAQDERVRQLLAGSQSDLTRSLETRGIRLEGFSVSTLSSTTTDTGQGRQAPSEHKAVQLPRYSEPHSKPLRAQVRIKTTGLDLAI